MLNKSKLKQIGERIMGVFGKIKNKKGDNR